MFLVELLGRITGPEILAALAALFTVLGPAIVAIGGKQRLWDSSRRAEPESTALRRILALVSLLNPIKKRTVTPEGPTPCTVGLPDYAKEQATTAEQKLSREITGVFESSEARPKKGEKVGEFTTFFEGPFRGDGTSDKPSLASQPIEPPRKKVGDFTAVFGPTGSKPEQSPPALEESGNNPASPTSFTGMFKDMGTPPRTFNTSTPLPPPPSVPAPPKEPSPPAYLAPPPPLVPPTQAVLPPPPIPSVPSQKAPMPKPSALPGDGAIGAFQQPSANTPAPVVPKVAFGPSPYTQIISREKPTQEIAERRMREIEINIRDEMMSREQVSQVPRSSAQARRESPFLSDTSSMLTRVERNIEVTTAPPALAHRGSTMLVCYAVVLLIFGAIAAIHYWDAIMLREDLAFTMGGLLLTMVAGMFVQVITSNYKASSPLFHVTASQLAYPLLFSPIVFYPVWALTTGGSQHLFAFYAAFLDGYFWESVVSSAKTVNVDAGDSNAPPRRRRRKLPVTPQPA